MYHSITFMVLTEKDIPDAGMALTEMKKWVS
jgi:hypothetical protein